MGYVTVLKLLATYSQVVLPTDKCSAPMLSEKLLIRGGKYCIEGYTFHLSSGTYRIYDATGLLGQRIVYQSEDTKGLISSVSRLRGLISRSKHDHLTLSELYDVARVSALELSCKHWARFLTFMLRSFSSCVHRQVESVTTASLIGTGHVVVEVFNVFAAGWNVVDIMHGIAVANSSWLLHERAVEGGQFYMQALFMHNPQSSFLDINGTVRSIKNLEILSASSLPHEYKDMQPPAHLGMVVNNVNTFPITIHSSGKITWNRLIWPCMMNKIYGTYFSDAVRLKINRTLFWSTIRKDSAYSDGGTRLTPDEMSEFF